MTPKHDDRDTPRGDAPRDRDDERGASPAGAPPGARTGGRTPYVTREGRVDPEQRAASYPSQMPAQHQEERHATDRSEPTAVRKPPP